MDKIATGARIKALRFEKGWSQKELAEKVGRSQPIVGRWESGDHAAPPEALRKIAELFDRPLAWLTEAGAETDPAQDTLKQYDANPMLDSAKHVLRMHGYEPIPRIEYETWEKIKSLTSPLAGNVTPFRGRSPKVNRKLPGYHRGLLSAAVFEDADPAATQRLRAQAQRRIERNKPIAS